jgi:hypothetical protein
MARRAAAACGGRSRLPDKHRLEISHDHDHGHAVYHAELSGLCACLFEGHVFCRCTRGFRAYRLREFRADVAFLIAHAVVGPGASPRAGSDRRADPRQHSRAHSGLSAKP